MFYTLIKHRFLTNESAQGPIYILYILVHGKEYVIVTQ